MSWETYRSDDSNPFINTLLELVNCNMDKRIVDSYLNRRIGAASIFVGSVRSSDQLFKPIDFAGAAVGQMQMTKQDIIEGMISVTLNRLWV